MKHLQFKRFVEGTEKLNQKYSDFNISGKNTSKVGNFVFKAVPIGNGFDIWFKDIHKNELVFRNVKFPFRGYLLRMILSNQDIKIPICYTIVRKVDEFNRVYYQVKVTVDISVGVKVVTSTARGAVGMDFNIGHIDLTNIDAKGNILDTKTIYYDVADNIIANEISLRKAIRQAVEYAFAVGKDLVIEKLDTTNSKNKSTYRNKAINKIFHSFAYAKYTKYVEYAGTKYGVNIIKVNPAYTSYIGRVKYGKKCLNSHVLASYVIARRGLGFTEIVPKELKSKIKAKKRTKHHWAHWADLKKQDV